MRVPMRTVELTTAGHPPPSDLSSTMGSVSFVMTLLRSSVTRTQCLPRSSSFKTFFAFLRSCFSPEEARTWR